MRFLSLAEVLRLHQALLDQSGGAPGLLDLGALESAVAQPLVTFDGDDLYPSLEEKAAALCFSLVSNHPFADGNKRIAHAAIRQSTDERTVSPERRACRYRATASENTSSPSGDSTIGSENIASRACR